MGKSKKKQRLRASSNVNQKKGKPFAGRRWLMIFLLGVFGCMTYMIFQFIPRDLKPQVVVYDPIIPSSIQDPAITAAIKKAIGTVKENTDSDENWGVLGMVYLVHEFREEAQRALSQAAKIRPNNAKWHYLEALCYFPDDISKGVRSLEKARDSIFDLENPQERLAIRRRLGYVYLENGQFNEAEKLFTDILSGSPKDESALLGLGQIRNQQGLFEDALPLLRACETHPVTRKRAQQSMAVALRGLGQNDLADELVQTAARLPDGLDWADPFITLASAQRVGLQAMLEDARLLMQHGRSSDAIAILERVLNDYPDSAEGYFLKSDVQLRSGDVDVGISNLLEGLRLNDQNHLAWIQLGLAYGGQQKMEQAIDSFQKAIAISPSAADAHYNLGIARMASAQDDEALSSFLNAVRYEPNMIDSYIAAAQIFEKKLDWEKAKDLLEKALDISPEDVRVRLLLERVLSSGQTAKVDGQ